MSGGRLTVVFSSSSLGGSEMFNLEFLRVAHRHGVRFDAIVPGDGPLLERLQPLVERVRQVPIPSQLTNMSRFESRVDSRALPARVASLVRYAASLGRALAACEGPVCAFGFRSQLAVSIATAPRRSIGWVVHEVVPPGPAGNVWRLAAKRANRIWTYSEAAKQQPNLVGRPVVRCQPRLDLARFSSIAAPRAVNTVGLIGDLIELKNHHGALDAVGLLRGRGFATRLAMTGRPYDGAVPRAKAYAETVTARVAHVPWADLAAVSPAAMPDAVRNFDVLLHLSTVPESFGRVCVEAMAAGRPVIAFDHGAVSELIEPGRTGYLCPIGDLEAVSRAIEKLARDPNHLADMSDHAREAALGAFGEDPERTDTIGDALVAFGRGGR